MARLIKKYTKYQRIRMVKPHIYGTVLDLGCDDRALEKVCRCQYTGYDIKEGFDIDKHLADIPDNSYDHVTMLAVIEHLQEPRKALINALRIARETVILTTPKKEAEKYIRLYSPSVSSEHTYYFDRAYFDGFTVVHYQTFECGLNQLVILKSY